MGHSSFIYVANWKAYLSYAQAQAWIAAHQQTLIALANNHTIIVCPSFDALAEIAHILKQTPVQLGAQDCSEHSQGAFTGQVLAESLTQIGCKYVIIGHSETKKECPQTVSKIAQKAICLLTHNITPIICIGESAQDFELNRTLQVLEEQLQPILKSIAQQVTPSTIIVGYEPLWAIGTGIIPETDFLQKTAVTIKGICAQYAPHHKILLLYGGGVNEVNCIRFKQIPQIDGILLGGASTDFQKLEKIVLS